jgi:hypothetical protein
MKPALPAVSLLLALAAPSLALANAWTLDTQGEAATLTFGSNEPEDDHQTLSCRPGSGEVRIYFRIDHRPSARAGVNQTWTTQVTVASGAVRAALPAQANGEEMYGGTEFNVRLPARSPVITAFSRSGRLRFTGLGRTVTPGAARPAVVARFLRACR